MPSWLSNRLKHPKKPKPAGREDMAQGMTDYQKAIADYAAKGNQQYTNAGDLADSGMANIKTDPRYAAHEQAALADLEQISKDGMSARDLADIAKNDSRVNRQAAGRQGAIRQNMAARGMSGSGMDLVAQMQSSQDATENQALASMEKNAQAQEGRRQAISQRGQLSGQLSARDFQQQAQQAQAQDSINRFNQANRQQVMNNNTQGANQFAGNVMQAQQGGAQMRYNNGAEQANRQLAGQGPKANPLKGALGGAAAGFQMGGPWGAVAGGVAGAGAEYMYDGDRVTEEMAVPRIPGPVFGPENNPKYDTVNIMASPGEAVVSKSDLRMFDSIDDPNVREYIKKKYGSEADMQSAKDNEKYAKVGQFAAGIGDQIANNNRDPKVYHNSMQNLGQAPKITQNELQKTDMSGAVNAATKNRQDVEGNRDEAIKSAFAERKSQLATQAEAAKAAEDKRRYGIDNDFKTQAHNDSVANTQAILAGTNAGRAETNRHNLVTEAAGALKANEPPKQTPAQAKQEATSKEVKYRVGSINSALDRLEANIKAHGTFEAFGNADADMSSDIYNVALDYAKLVDPDSVAREGEVASAQKYMLPIQGMFKDNDTALANVARMREQVAQRAADMSPMSVKPVEQKGDLSPEEHAELEQLEKQFGGK